MCACSRDIVLCIRDDISIRYLHFGHRQRHHNGDIWALRLHIGQQLRVLVEYFILSPPPTLFLSPSPLVYGDSSICGGEF